MPHDARAIANYILDATDRLGLSLTNMALNKVIYFSHGWHLALYQEPLINGQFEAWEHGPVLPVLYHAFKSHKDRPITSRATRIDLATGHDVISVCVPAEIQSGHLDKMIAFYATKSAPLLSHMSHEPGAPWDSVRGNANQVGMTIRNEVIEEYFSSKLRSRKPTSDGQA